MVTNHTYPTFNVNDCLVLLIKIATFKFVGSPFSVYELCGIYNEILGITGFFNIMSFNYNHHIHLWQSHIKRQRFGLYSATSVFPLCTVTFHEIRCLMLCLNPLCVPIMLPVLKHWNINNVSEEFISCTWCLFLLFTRRPERADILTMRL